MKTKKLINILIAVGLLVIAGCSSSPVRESNSANYLNRATNETQINCKLPGQIRRLGAYSSYLTPQRLVHVTEMQCKIRGGQLV